MYFCYKLNNVVKILFMTVTAAVSQYIKKKPYLSSALSDGIINLTSLARHIQVDIEKNLRKPVNKGAIIMALKRIQFETEMNTSRKIVKVLRAIGDITVRSNLTDYSFKISDTLLDAQARFLEEVKNDPNIFYTSSRGVTESNIIVSSDLTAKIETYFKKEILIEKTDNLSSISMKLPIENVTVPGIYYFIFQRLSWEGVNIFEVISTSNEFTILVGEDYVNVAFKAIKELKSL